MITARSCNDPLFLNFLEGCLRWDHTVRFTPEQALQVSLPRVCEFARVHVCVSFATHKPTPPCSLASTWHAPRIPAPSDRRGMAQRHSRALRLREC